MQIVINTVKVKDLVNGYLDNDEDGVFGFDGKLNIRPPYQREFVYDNKKRDAVINTVIKEFPLGSMYWVSIGENNRNENRYEVLDGQQRTISVCQFIRGQFSIPYEHMTGEGVKPTLFNRLPEEVQEQILEYELNIYFCDGTDREKLDWFKIINIAGEKLTSQELRNAVHAGPWLMDAKRYFSRTGCAGYGIGSRFVRGSPIRQDFLEESLKWISSGDIDNYMSLHKDDDNAVELWDHFRTVVSWVELVFTEYRKEMKGVNWGFLHDLKKDIQFNSADIETRIKVLMEDEEVSKKSGIYPYILLGEEKYLNLRLFTLKQKRQAFERQGVENQKAACPMCVVPDNMYKIDDMEADHIIPWSQGGVTNMDNLQMLCKKHNREKSDS